MYAELLSSLPLYFRQKRCTQVLMFVPYANSYGINLLCTGLHLLLGKFDLTYDSIEFMTEEKPTAQELMEFPLRCQVMVAQSHAGMWRRNGYSLLHQVTMTTINTRIIGQEIKIIKSVIFDYYHFNGKCMQK